MDSSLGDQHSQGICQNAAGKVSLLYAPQTEPLNGEYTTLWHVLRFFYKIHILLASVKALFFSMVLVTVPTIMHAKS